MNVSILRPAKTSLTSKATDLLKVVMDMMMRHIVSWIQQARLSSDKR